MYRFNLKNKENVDELRSPYVYQYNMARNLALLSNDESVIRRFFQVQVPKYNKDSWLAMESKDMFMGQYIPGQAFCYFGLIPMIVQGKVNLVASAGFKCDSDDKAVADALNNIKEEANLQEKFVKGAYWESGIGDFAFRVCYDPELSDKPIIDVIEPQFLEVNYSHGVIKSYVVKEVSKEDADYVLCEIHYKNTLGYVCVDYRYKVADKYIDMTDDSLVKECESKFDFPRPKNQVFPFRDFLIIFKKNANQNMLYKGERGVPDIQGLVSIEDALTESISDLIDAIRKGGVKEYVSDELIPQDAEGNDMRLNHFNKTIITTKGSSTPGESGKLWQVTQGDIKWEAYTRTIQNLMSVGINKAGLSPTTIGLTGLESINSSAESQDAREKTSMRTREVALESWRVTLKELLNRYLQVKDYIQGKSIVDYSGLINITFNEYTNPTLENITNVLAKQVQTGLKAQVTAIKELNKGMTEEQAREEYTKIQQENTGMQPTEDGGGQGRGNQKITFIPVN